MSVQALFHLPLALPTTAALAFSMPAVPARATPADAEAIIARLDLSSFDNSTGPRRAAGKTSFSDYGFTQVERTGSGARLVAADGGWEMHFTILAQGPDSIDICLRDRGLMKNGSLRAPSYDARSALRIVRSSSGRWSARQLPDGFAGCANEPPAHP